MSNSPMMGQADTMACVTVEVAAQQAIMDFNERGLTSTAAWLGELLLAADSSVLNSPVILTNRYPDPLVGAMKTKLMLAAALFTQQEYRRCHNLLETTISSSEGASLMMAAPSTHSPPPRSVATEESLAVQSQHPSVLFLCSYARYMEGEKRCKIGSGSVGPEMGLRGVNPYLPELYDTMVAATTQHPRDPYLHWLYGVVLSAIGNKQEAAQSFLNAVTIHPLLWCAWEELSTLIHCESQRSTIMAAVEHTEFSFMRQFFSAKVSASIQQFNDALSQWEALIQQFPRSIYIKSQCAHAHYMNTKYDVARPFYEEVHAMDPYRLEGMDEYSNVLFTRGDKLALSNLVHDTFGVDPFRAESCSVAANYYAMLRKHEKSVLYFKRAVTIDPRLLSAWTLLGHEYLEVQNTSAAIDAYRCAVAIDSRDYRPWYGLGQIYELLGLGNYSLFYYRQTTTLRPNDARMWFAVANCLEKTAGQKKDVIACLERAEQFESSTVDGYSLLVRRIAEYHRDAHDPNKAAHFFEKLLNCPTRSEEDLLSALPFLAEHYSTLATSLLDIPARSRSFDPSQLSSRSSAPRTSENNKARAMQLVEVAKQHLADLRHIVPPEAPGCPPVVSNTYHIMSKVASDIAFVENCLCR